MSSPSAERASLAFAALAVLGAGAMAYGCATDPDLGFHLATGRAVLASGRIPAHNVFTFDDGAHRWILQQGVPALLFALVERAAGAAGLLALKVACVAATFGLAYAAARRFGAAAASACATTLLAAFAASFRFVERPLLFSNLALAATMLAMAVVLGTDVERTRRRALAAYAAVLGAAMNLHAGAVFLPIAALALAAGHALARVRDAAPRKVALEVTAASVAGFGIGSAVLALYHPYPLAVLTVPFQMGADVALRTHLVEFRAPFDFPLALTAPYFALLVLAFVAQARAPRPLAGALALAAFAALSLRFFRLADAFALVASPLAAAALTLRRAANPSARASRGSLGAHVALVTLLAMTGIAHAWSNRPPRPGFEPNVFGTALLGRVEALGLEGRAFVSDGWAGPYLARRGPGHLVHFFPNFEAFSQARYAEYMDVRYGRPGWDRTLDARRIELVVLKHTSPGERRLQHGAPNLRQHLAEDARWSLVAFDDLGAVWVRTQGVNRARAAELGVQGVDPDRVRLLGPVPAARIASLAPRTGAGRRHAALLAAARAVR